VSVEVGLTGVAVGDPVRLVESVPLVTGPTEVGRVPLLGLAFVPPVETGMATVESVLTGQYVVVKTCVTVVLLSAEVVVKINVTTELALAVEEELKVIIGGSPEAETKDERAIVAGAVVEEGLVVVAETYTEDDETGVVDVEVTPLGRVDAEIELEETGAEIELGVADAEVELGVADAEVELAIDAVVVGEQPGTGKLLPEPP